MSNDGSIIENMELSHVHLAVKLIFVTFEKKICSLICTPPRPSEISKNKKLEGKGEASFDTPFMIQSRAESMKEIV